jgi:hypothetical protein
MTDAKIGVPRHRVDARRGLVENDDLGSTDESDGDANPASDALGQISDRPVFHLLDFHRFQQSGKKAKG